MQALIASLRVTIATLIVCVAGYALAIYGVAQAATPATAEASLVTLPDGKVVGSRLVAQKFEKRGYFWSRPSAADYNASGAAGSNKSPTSPDLTDRATKTVAAYGATVNNPLPADLAAASGSGLDPDITESGARYQALRVAKARGVPVVRIESLVSKHTYAPGAALTPDRLVNVLMLNVALDREFPAH